MGDQIKIEADRRHASHVDHPTHRPLSDGYELIGLRGEEAVAAAFGGSVDLRPRPAGDGGVDMLLTTRAGTFAVDAKAARKAFNLIVEVGKVRIFTIYILGQYSDLSDRVTLLGWEWGSSLLKAPKRDFGYGVINHYIHRSRLRRLSDLLDQME